MRINILKYIVFIAYTLASLNSFALDFDGKRKESEKLIYDGKYEEGLNIIKELAEAGDIESQIDLGGYYLERNDYEKSIFWLDKAISSDNARAQYLIGIYYIQKTPQEYEKGIKWLRASASQGYRRAQEMLKQITQNSKLPDKLNGDYKVSDILKFISDEMNAQLTSNTAGLQCYKLDVSSFKAVYPKISYECRKQILEEAPSTIKSKDDIMLLSGTLAQCIRGEMQNITNVSNEDLISCSRSIK